MKSREPTLIVCNVCLGAYYVQELPGITAVRGIRVFFALLPYNNKMAAFK
jgi:hypothetical protein